MRSGSKLCYEGYICIQRRTLLRPEWTTTGGADAQQCLIHDSGDNRMLVFGTEQGLQQWGTLELKIQVALFYSYSTDFEVHRNWLAITYNFPTKLWYYENTSEWTLDYPPLFAWFEWGLSHVAKYVDPEMIKISNLNYASDATLLFQRLSVIITDFVFIYAVKLCVDYFVKEHKITKLNDPWLHKGTILSILLIWNTGLLLVDHIHFQYNGFLMGIWFLSIIKILQGKDLQGAFWYAILLNFKHIYLYVAPAYFFYLLRNHCFPVHMKDFKSKFGYVTFMKRLSSLAFIVIAVFGVSLGPFLLMGQLSEILKRLFPFGRGLTHAYWAPNFWALYNVFDKFLSLVCTRFNIYQPSFNTKAMTGGLVQVYNHAILPSIYPTVTVILTCSTMIPALVKLWKNPKQPIQFLRCLVICAFSAFMFGWHVHEKAIILVILPLTLLALVSKEEATIYLILSTTGHFSLFPLIHTSFGKYQQNILVERSGLSFPLLNTIETMYIIGFIPVQLFYSFGLLVFGLTEKLPFLPLLIISVYCAFGVTASYLRFYMNYMFRDIQISKR
ncbi:putative dolichyl pyrophosphate Glc1Man9GlcNAc2 alpha-1,3-glucosyltransferase [Nymphon striatum]|nr:putative dolichyl pyrophosphate Glc1Man9GlcNAc2 alpha-1,3-glucosyltransferase [Nymphon striatum]